MMNILHSTVVESHIISYSKIHKHPLVINGAIKWFERLDGPIIIQRDGTREWKLNHDYHREDGPAIEYANGTKKWYIHGKLHRDDGPAVEYANGDQRWYRHGKLVEAPSEMPIQAIARKELIKRFLLKFKGQ